MPPKLNPAQYAAVTTLSGPLLVLAGAGTGKTRVVTYRIAELIRHGTPPDRILAVTFTRKAAAEMLQRAAALLGKRLPARPEISTFHSLCARVLRRQIRHLGYPSHFAIYDRGDQESIARGVLREIRVGESLLRPGDLLYLISRWKSASVAPAQAAASAHSDREHLAAAGYRRYQDALKAAGAVDFDDLLLCTEELLGRFSEVRREESGRFDHVLIDEYQDTNVSQYRIVKALAGEHRNLCVVGDDDQSIYGWRGAEVTHILRFKQDWPEAKVVRLETNYRCPRQIVDWANRLIAFNKLRHDKRLEATFDGPPPRILQLPDETEEAKTVVSEINAQVLSRKARPGDFAILCRTNEQPRPFETEMRRADLPYVLVGGMSFYDRKEVRDVLAYLKLLAHPRDEVALLRIINTPPRGIGQSTVRRLTETAVAEGIALWDLLGRRASVELASPAIEGINGLRALVGKHRRSLDKAGLARVIRELVEDVGYRGEIARLYSDPNEQESRWSAVEEVVNAAAAYARRSKNPSLPEFLQELALSERDDTDDKESRLKRDAVVLMTLHSAKGLEFPHVYLVGMEEGLLPHRRSVEVDGAAVDEERRLCYVGVTRAQRTLTLTRALARRKWGKARETVASRFLYELTGQADNPNYLKATRKGRTPGPKSSHKRAKRTRSSRKR